MDDVRERIEFQLEKLHVVEGDVLVVKVETGRDAGLIANHLQTICPQMRGIIFLYPPHAEISVLDGEQLIGWLVNKTTGEGSK